MYEVKPTSEQEALLRAQVIDRDHPGSVVWDFEAVLDYVGTQGVKAGGKYNLLPIDAIKPLDAKLSRPLHLDLERPQLRSHPYLQGLHLLLRATGLAQVEGAGSKARLVVDAPSREAWDKLNLTEKYFTLLEAWLLVGTPEMIGERGWSEDGFLEEHLSRWDYLRREPFDNERGRGDRLSLFGIRGFMFSFALMDLFGLVEIDFPQSSEKGWVPAGARVTPFGAAMYALLRGWELRNRVFHTAGEEDEGPPGFGQWQELMRPSFPEWENNLVLPVPERREGTCVFRVSLGNILWREIAIGDEETLEDLVPCILNSVKFDFDHLYEFRFRDVLGRRVSVRHPVMDEGPFTDEVEIGALPLKVGQSMTFMYDFGDNWEFDVKLMRIDPPSRGKLPKVLKKHGKAPPQYPRWEF
jgi:hypothetical protein